MKREELLKIAKPILFNTEMVKAILENRKTVTRRLIKLDLGLADTDKNDSNYLKIPDEYGDYHDAKDLCRYKVGDIIYVRETFTEVVPVSEDGTWDFDNVKIYYYANDEDREVVNNLNYIDEDGFLMHRPFPWKPSIHMPKKLARIFLKVTDVRVERVKDITEKQAIKEGFNSKEEFINAILEIYPEHAEESWVWVIEFERVEVE